MRIKNIHTEEESEISFHSWLSKAGKSNFEIIERGDIVFVTEMHKDDTVEYLFDLDRDHAIRMIKQHPTRYSLEELSELPYSVMINIALRELDWKKTKSADLNTLVNDLKFNFTLEDIHEFTNDLNSTGLAKAITHKDGGQLTLTLKGKEHLKNTNKVRKSIYDIKDQSTVTKTSKPNMSAEKEVFLTYSWDSEEYKDMILGFCNHLREKGFSTDIDRKISQEQASADFTKMMHRAMTDYDKVIIVLSKGYKLKADIFEGGVGAEYSLIIKDINNNPNKYILVSFEEISDDIFPLNFKDREVLDLTDPDKYETLYAKLQNINQISFSTVAETKPAVKVVSPKAFVVPVSRKKEEEKLSASNINITLKTIWADSKQLHSYYWHVAYNLIVSVENLSKSSISNFSIEVILDNKLTKYDSVNRVSQGNKIFTKPYDQKLFPTQEVEIECGNLRVDNAHADLANNSQIQINVYTDDGLHTETFNIQDRLVVKDQHGRKKVLQLKDFHPPNARQ